MTGLSFSSDIWVLVQGLILLWLVIEDHDNLFVMSEFVHFAGIGALLWKLVRQRNSGGILPPLCHSTAIVFTYQMDELRILRASKPQDTLQETPQKRLSESLTCRFVAEVTGANSPFPRNSAYLQVSASNRC